MRYVQVKELIRADGNTVLILVEAGNADRAVCVSLPREVNEELFIARVKQAYAALEQMP